MKIALCLFGLGVVVALLVGTELCLRLFGVAAPPPLLLPLTAANGRRLVTNNQLFPLRFFFRRYEGKYTGVGEMNLQVFWTPKPSDTVRILFVGASSVQGFPHPRNLNAAAFLRASLQDLLPGKQVEVINLGTTALASFGVWKVLEEAAEVAPDAVVAYLGHNEFFGAYGVASLMRAASGPLGCRLHYAFRQTRLARLLFRLKEPSGKPEVTEKDLMEIMAALEYLGADDARRSAAYVNLKANLEAMADTARQWGVPLVVGTLVSNEKDIVPVRSYVPELEPGVAARWQRLADGGTWASLEEATTIVPGNAAVYYRMGKLRLEEKRFAEARTLFQRAIDLDAMPWRACSRANEIIRSLAVRPGVFLANVEVAFRKKAVHGILGSELFLDHVHPTTEGQGLMAHAFVDALARALPDLTMNPKKLRPLSRYRIDLGDCSAVQYHLLNAMTALFSKEPLAKNNRALAAQFARRAKGLYATMHPAHRAAYDVWKNLPRGMLRRPLVMVCADAMQQRTRAAEPNFAEAARLFSAGIHATPPYTPMRLEAVERTLANRWRLQGGFSAADRQLAADAARMGHVMLKTPLSDKKGVEAIIEQLKLYAGR